MTTARFHPFTCAYCTGDGVTRPQWLTRSGYQNHMESLHHGLPMEPRNYPDADIAVPFTPRRRRLPPTERT